MKKIYVIVIAFLLFSSFSVSAAALEPEELIEDLESCMPEDSPFAELDPESLYSAVSPAAILGLIADAISGNAGALTSFFLTLFAVVAISFCAGCAPNYLGGTSRAALLIVLSSAAALTALPIMRSIIRSLSECDGLFLSVSAVFSSLSLAAGGGLSAAAEASGALLISSVCATVASRILPFIAALGFFSSVLTALGGTEGLCRGVSRLYTRALGITTLLVGIILSTQGIVASAADNATIRAIKYGAQTAIPLVGGAVSSTLSLLAGGLGYAKGIIGAGAIGALIYALLAPLALLFIYRMMIGAALMLSELIGAPDLGSLSALSGLFDALIASVSLCGSLYLIEAVIFLVAGVSL